MLKRKYRLPAGMKLAHPSSFKSQSFRLMIIQNNLDYSRFGFIVSKKIDKRSVVRNRIKRQMRSVIEEILQKIADKYDMLFIIQKNALGKKRQEFYQEIETLLIKIHLIKNDKTL